MEAVRSACCPFCKRNVANDLVLFGGNCPHCLLEIPGEEAPTDPGALAREKAQVQAAVKQRSNLIRNVILAFAGAAMLSVVAVIGVWQAQQEQEARTYEMPDDLYLPPLQEAGVPSAQPEQVVETPTTPGRKAPPNVIAAAPRTALPTEPIALPTLGDLPVIGSPTPVAGSTQTSTGPKRSTSSDLGDAQIVLAAPTAAQPVLIGTPITKSTAKGPLSDETEIFEMIKQVMGRYQPQVQTCYYSRLKQIPDLAGGWKLSFVVAKDGATKGVKVAAVGTADADLESCIVRTISAWTFLPIIKDQPVTKTVRFGASSW